MVLSVRILDSGNAAHLMLLIEFCYTGRLQYSINENTALPLCFFGNIL